MYCKMRAAALPRLNLQSPEAMGVSVSHVDQGVKRRIVAGPYLAFSVFSDCADDASWPLRATMRSRWRNRLQSSNFVALGVIK
jgi:hypothetical protein